MMKSRAVKKMTALFVSLCMMLVTAGVVMADTQDKVTIKSVTIGSDSTVEAAELYSAYGGEYVFYAAVYENGVLAGVDVSEITLAADETVVQQLDGGLRYDENTQDLKCYVWDYMTPVSEAYSQERKSQEATAQPSVTEAPEATQAPSVTENPEATQIPEETDAPADDKTFTVSFETDGNASVTVSLTQDFTDGSGLTENAASAIARDGATGEALSDGNGQVNFMVVVGDGYEIESVTAEPANYKNLKDVGNGVYRITKITGDLTVTVTTKQTQPADPSATQTPGDGIIHLMGDSIDAAGVDNVTVSGTTVTITAGGEYTIEGTLDDGQIAVAASAKTDIVTINLDGVNVTNSSGNAFNATKGAVTLVPTSNASTFKTTSSGENNTDTTAIYSKNDLTIKGDGTLSAISEYGNGIRCKNDLEIGVCDLVVDAGNNGIKGDESVKVTKKNNSITINSVGDGIKSDDAPSTDAATGDYVSGGTVEINGGKITITTGTDSEGSTGDGIQADTLLTINGGTINIDAAGEALKANASSVEYLEDTAAAQTPSEGDGCIVINGGTITASALEDGIKAVKSVTVNDGNVTVTKACEGIQVKEVVYDTDGATVRGYVAGTIEITGGSVDITASEDGIQCGTGNVNISGGNVTVNSGQDCIQAENILNITGGIFDLTAHDGASSKTSTTDSAKGLKAQNLVNVEGGTFDIDTYDDSVHSNHTVRVSGGRITAASTDDGVHGDSFLIISGDADINVTKSYEGIEAAEIYIEGGETRVVASDDGANAAGDEPSDSAYDVTDNAPSITLSSVGDENDDYSLMAGGPGGMGNWGGGGPGGNMEDTSNYGYLEVSGGLLYVEAEGDGFDSNGDGFISGGTVLVNGPVNGGNGVFDVGDNGNTLKITGGTVIGAGTSDMPVTPTADTNSQYYVCTTLSSNNAAGSVFSVSNSSGTQAVYKPSKNYKWILVSLPGMSSGSYTLSAGGSVSDGTWLGNYAATYGLMQSGTYSGGSSTTLTATTGGSSSGGQGGPGQGGPGQGGPGR